MLCMLQLPVPRIVPDTYKVLLGRKEGKEGRRKGGRKELNEENHKLVQQGDKKCKGHLGKVK